MRLGRAQQYQPSDALHFSPIQVEDLKATLAIQEEELKVKKENTDKLIHVVGVEKGKVSKEKAIADAEELKVQAINKVSWCQPHQGPTWDGAARALLAPAAHLIPSPHFPRSWLRSNKPARPTWRRQSRRS